MTDENKSEDAEKAPSGNLNDVFSNNSEDSGEVEATPTKTQKSEPELKGDDEEAEVEQTEEESDAEPPSEKDTEGKSVPVAALKSERQKRQAAELERDELKKKIAQSGEVAEEPDLDQKLFNERTNLSREIMMEAKPDYQEMEDIFIEIAKKDEALVNAMRRSTNPAKFAYTKAKEHLEYQQFLKDKDSDEYKEFLKAKAEGKTAKAVEETPEQKRKKLALSVPNLNKATSMASNSTKTERVPTLNEMFD